VEQLWWDTANCCEPLVVIDFTALYPRHISVTKAKLDGFKMDSKQFREAAVSSIDESKFVQVNNPSGSCGKKQDF
jgi:hypothetical protein